jgi:signal transduction histidine kinase
VARYDLESLERRNSLALDLVTGAAIVVGIAALFVFDISQPRGIVDGVGYAGLVALGVRFGNRVLIACAVLTTLLTLVAAFLLPDSGISVEGMWENRGFAIVSIWLVAAILLRRLWLEDYIRSRERKLQHHQAALGAIVREALLIEKSQQARVQRITELAGEAMQCDLTAIFHVSDNVGRSRTIDCWDRENKTHFALPETPGNDSPEYKQAIEKDFVAIADDILTSPAHRNRLGILQPLGVRAILTADPFVGPMRLGLSFAFRAPHHWTAQEIAFARGVQNLVALSFATSQNAETLATLDQVSEAIYTEGRSGSLQYANRAAKALSRLEFGASQKSFPHPEAPLSGDSDMHEVRYEERDLEIQRTRLPEGGILTRINDVTARNAALAARMQYEARLQQSAKMEAIGQLAGGVAHDFNNILGSILGFAGFLVQDLPEGSAERGFAARILSACERGKDLVEQILSFARARAVERGVVDLGLLLKRSQEFLAELLPPQIALKMSLAENALPVFGSATQIGQLITNLCINARDAFADQPGTISITTRLATSPEIAGLREPVEARSERLFGDVQAGVTYCLLRVEDDGAGIAPEILDRVFEPFFTTKGRHRGTGLGLAVVHGVIESTGGVCRLSSVPGKGTVFSIYFPLVGERIAEAGQSGPLAASRGSERVLIVDDEPDIADMLAIGLERLGYETVGVNDPLEALAAFRENPQAFDVVVTDQVMPGLRGLDLIRRMKEIRPGIITVLCTGFSDGANAEVSLAAGADAFFHKPVDATQIAQKIRTLVGPKG